MADNDGKIYITISDRRFGSNVAEADEQNKIDKTKEDKKESTLQDFAKHRFFNFIESQAKQAVNYSISNIGNFTGDYVGQQHIQDAINIINTMSNIGVAALAGAKYGPLGAAIGAGIAIAGTGINMSLQYIAGYSQNVLQNRQIAQLRTRAGLNSTNNGSRGTEY